MLAGVVVGTIFNSLQTGVFYFIDSNGAMRTAVSWLASSLTGVAWMEVRLIVLPTLLVVPLAMVAARQLNVLLLGERRARALGMPVETMRFALSALAIFATAAAVSVAGLVGGPYFLLLLRRTDSFNEF